jgi:hypothetical protein
MAVAGCKNHDADVKRFASTRMTHKRMAMESQGDDSQQLTSGAKYPSADHMIITVQPW